MATLYIDGASGDDANAGTITAPKKTGAAIATFITANPTDSTVFIADTIRGENVILTGMTRCHFLQWPGRNEGRFSSITLFGGTWVNSTGDEWTITLATGLDLVRISEDWDTNINWAIGNGAHQGLLSVGTLPGLSANEFDYNSGTGLLTIRTLTDEDPNTNGRQYGWCLGGNGVSVTGTACTFDDLAFGPCPDLDSGNNMAYCFKMNGCTTTIATKCRFDDGGYRGGGSAGAAGSGNGFVDCDWYGGAPAGSSTVLFSNVVGAVSGFITRGNFYGTLFRDRVGTMCDDMSSNSPEAIILHTDEDDGILDGIIITDCHFVGYDNAFTVGQVSPLCATPSNLDDPTTYPIQFINCTGTGISRVCKHTSGGTAVSAVAYIRCNFDCEVWGAKLPSGAFNPIYWTNHDNAYAIFDSCIIVFDDDDEVGKTIFRLDDNVNELRFLNCIILDSSTSVAPGNGNHKAFFVIDELDGLVKARGSLFGYSTVFFQHHLIAFGISVPAAQQDFKDCWYLNIDDVDGYSENTDHDALAEWTSLIDPNGIYATTPGFTTVPTNMEGTSASALRTTTKILALASAAAINLGVYDGHYGPYQYGAVVPTAQPVVRIGPRSISSMLYRLKRSHGRYAQIMRAGHTETRDYATGAMTSTFTSKELKRVIILPARQARDFVSNPGFGAVYDLRDRTVIIDKTDIDFDLDLNDFIQFEGKRWEIAERDDSVDGRSVVLIVKNTPNSSEFKAKATTSGFWLVGTASATI